MSAGARLQRLEALDVSTMSAGAAHAALRDLGVVRGSADQLEGAIARRLATLHAEGSAPPASDALGRNGRSSRKAAEQAERRAHTLGETPRLNRALGRGTVGAEHVDALAGVAARLDDTQRTQLFERDEELTELAASQSPETFRRKLNTIVDDITADDGLERSEQQAEAATYSSGVNNDSGMHWFRGELTPEHGNLIRRRIDAEANALAKRPEHCGKRRDQLDALALVNLITGARSDRGVPRADLVVLIPYDTLLGTSATAGTAEYSDGTPVPAATARRHACDANIIPVVMGGDSLPLDVGRARRLATPSQRHALRSMYRTRAIDGCDQHFDRCHIHHLDEWEDLGPTDLENLLPVCSFHHHRAHEGRWQLELDPSTRQLTVKLPNGALHSCSLPDIVEQHGAA